MYLKVHFKCSSLEILQKISTEMLCSQYKKAIEVPISKTNPDYYGLHQSDLLALRKRNSLHKFPNIPYSQ